MFTFLSKALRTLSRRAPQPEPKAAALQRRRSPGSWEKNFFVPPTLEEYRQHLRRKLRHATRKAAAQVAKEQSTKH